MAKRLLLMWVFAVLAATGAMAQAVIKFEKTSHNFGKFKETQKVQYAFTFTNTGDQPLVIQQAFASCGCTVANPPKDPIAPGNKGQITVTFNGKGRFPGYFKKPITVRSNAANSMVRVYIEGTLLADDK